MHWPFFGTREMIGLGGGCSEGSLVTFFIPLGVDEAKVDRLPWISIIIAITCVLAFFATWVLPANPMGIGDEEVSEVLQLWLEHPELQLDPAFSERFLNKEGQER